MGRPAEIGASSANEAFVRCVRQALRYLYDPTKLRGNPLFSLLGLAEGQSASRMREILIEAIEALRPEDSASPHSPAWRSYRILSHRYADQFPQSDVAASLGLSIRQLRRQESLALKAFADHLWATYDLRTRWSARGIARTKQEADRDEAWDAQASGRQGEIEWLERSMPYETVALAQLVDTAITTVRPLADALGSHVACGPLADLPRLPIKRMPLQQALLNALTAAIHAAPGGQVSISAEASSEQARITVHSVPQALVPPSNAHETAADGLELAQRLAALSGASLAIDPGRPAGEAFTATLSLPVTAEQLAALVIDDNADTLELFQRCLGNTRFSFVGTREPAQAFALAQEFSPAVIIVDVMLPGIDGWELIGRLREHPQTRGIPVVVCTILPQKQLALALGAAGFLHKPFTRVTLLQMLDSQLGS